MTALVDVDTTQRAWERILERVQITPDGCWRWPGSTNSKGYGQISVSGPGSLLVHRVALIVRDGHIPDGMVGDHTCHDPEVCPGGPTCPHRRCCNPDHLESVTIGENSRRGAQQKRDLCKRNHPLGTRTRGGKPVRCCRLCEAIARRSSRDGVSA